MAEEISVNETLYNRILDNAAMSNMFNNRVQIELGRVLKRHKKKLVSIVKENPKSPEIKREISRFVKEAYALTDGHIADFSSEQLDFHTNNLHKELKLLYDVKRPSKNKILETITGPNIKGDYTLSEQFARLGEQELKRVDLIIRRGIAEGISNAEMSSKVAKTLNITENQANALVRTAITRTQNLAQSEVLIANKAVMKGYQFTAILDSRTSEICSETDGKIFDIENTQWLPPLHWRCRSTIIPITKSFNELLATQDNRLRKKVLQKSSVTTRRRLDGRSIPKEGYGTWLKRQTQEVKLRHFGGDEERVRLFDSGNLSIKDFFTDKGKAVSLEALRRLDNFATSIVSFSTKTLNNDKVPIPVKARKPLDLIRNKNLQDDLKNFYIQDAGDFKQSLSLVDYKGTSLAGKRISRRRADNTFDERTTFVDPLTGEVKNSLLYDPDFNVYQERLDFLMASKILKQDQKEFVRNFVESLEDQMTVNQQSAVLENLRITFERFYDKNRPSYRVEWEDLESVLRAEMANSVVNTSRILDRRSRSRAQQFEFFGKASEEASIQIDNKWVSFDKIARDLDSTQAYVNNWRLAVGNKLARKAYYTGRAPLRTYFLDPIKVTLDPVKYIDKRLKKIPGYKTLKKKVKGEPVPSLKEKLIDDFIEKNTGTYRNILSTDRLLREQYLKTKESFLSKKQNNQAIQALSKAFEIVATARITDYDQLAITLSKQIDDVYPFKIFGLVKTDLKDHHARGSKLLKMLEENNMIKVTPRGITRRAAIDVDTGRPGGAWRDTLSREVLITDPELKKLQVANRELYIGKRIGITNENDMVRLRPGEKTYVTKSGRKTGDTVITRRANVHYDEVQLDRDLVDEINHANNFEWEVDPEYSTFMLDLVRYRDNRGQAKKFEELNGVRKIVLQRGDMGLGLMQTVKWHRDRNKPFKNVHQIDSRGRIYARGYLTPTGGEFVRPFLNTATSKEIGVEGWLNFKEQLGSLIGPTTEALTNAGRFRIFDRHQEDLLKLGRSIQSQTQREGNIRKVLENSFLQKLDPEEHPKLLRMALEYTRIYDHAKGDLNNLEKIATYKSKLPIEIDASASGAQIIALSTRNKALADASNITPTRQKNRLYDIMAMETVADPRFQDLGELVKDITWEDLSKAAKAQNMVAFYGAGAATQAANVADRFAQFFLDRDYIVVTRRKTSNTPKEAFSLLELNKIFDAEIKKAQFIGAENVVNDLNVMKKELNNLVLKDAPIGSKLRDGAKDVHPDVEDFVIKLTGNHSGIVGPSVFKTVSDIMSEKLAAKAPVTEQFIQFWKGVAQTYILETRKTDIPWVTFDGKIMTQRYRPILEEEIRFWDPNTGRYVKNIYKDIATDEKFLGKSSITDARTGLGVNGNHSNDAAIVRQFHLWGKKNKVDTATIHDAFFINIADASKAKNALRELYADAVESDIVESTLKAMRKEGLSKESYDKFRKEAIDRGLIVEDKRQGLTKQDIIRTLEDDEYFYGIGP